MLVRILVAALAGALVFFLGGWVIYGILLRSYFDSTMTPAAKSVMNTDPSFAPLIVAEIVFGIFFAFVFDYWASIRTLVGGIKAGAIMMFLLSLGWDLQMMAFFKDMHTGSPWSPMIVDILAATVLGVLAGGTIGAVLGLMRSNERAAA